MHVRQPAFSRERENVRERRAHRRRGREVVPLAATSHFSNLLIAVERSNLDRRRDLHGQAIRGIGAGVQHLDVTIVIPRQELHAVPVIRDVVDTGAARLRELRVLVVTRVDDPADIRDAHRQGPTGLVAEVVVRLAVAGVVIETPAVEFVLGPEAEKARTIQEATQD